MTDFRSGARNVQDNLVTPYTRKQGRYEDQAN